MQNRKIDSLQVLRGFAAIAVVFHHAFRAILVRAPADIHLPDTVWQPPMKLIDAGNFGVDIFFILSGFLMAYIAGPYIERRRTVGHFLAQRVLRIWPPYAIATAIICLMTMKKLLGGTVPYDLHFLRLCSFLFIPSLSERGELQPILGPGWTLNYEMLFYLCFASAIFVARRHILVALTAILGSLFAFGNFTSWQIPHMFFGNSIIFEFLFGAALDTFFTSGRFTPKYGWVWIASGLCIFSVLSLYPIEALPRFLSSGLPAAAIFTGMLALDRRVEWSTTLKRLGNASYSIYLMHLILIYNISYIPLRLLLKTPLQNASVFIIAIYASIVAILCGIAFYRYIEKPLLKKCQELLNRATGKNDPPPLVVDAAD